MDDWWWKIRRDGWWKGNGGESNMMVQKGVGGTMMGIEK